MKILSFRFAFAVYSAGTIAEPPDEMHEGVQHKNNCTMLAHDYFYSAHKYLSSIKRRNGRLSLEDDVFISVYIRSATLQLPLPIFIALRNSTGFRATYWLGWLFTVY